MTTPYILRYMRLDDIPQVVEIDKLAFSLPWSARSYVFEITDNNSSHMVVLERTDEQPRSGGIIGALRRLSGLQSNHAIIGYGGFWFIEGEAHISTIATHPDYRGKGLGEVLLTGMLARAVQLNAEYAVLECRVSNTAAITLYRKYEFEVVGKRKNYYRDNNEDAYLMHLAPMDNAYAARLSDRIQQLKDRVSYTDLFTHQSI